MDAHTLQALSDWLAPRRPDAVPVTGARKFTGGQSNPTYRLETQAGPLVLRRKPAGVLLKSAHAVEREFRVQRALATTDVPVARVHLFCEDERVIGTPFYLMDEVNGRIFDDPRLPDLPTDARGALIDEMNRVLVAIHSVDLAATGLGDFGPEGDYFARQLDRWTRQYRASRTEDLPDMEALIDWLGAHLPADDGQRCLVHGDYRLDNLVFARGGPDCLAVLDWELSTTGHPFADLAGVIMQWRMPAGRDGRGLSGVDRAGLGLWSDRQFLNRYAERRGLDRIGNFNFYLAFCHFRMGAILQGVKKRALDGTASDPERGLKLGTQVPQFAREGLIAAQGPA